MDFLDSLDLHKPTQYKKCNRMRSWYLYEQFKSLEQNQLDAAQNLRNRSQQERLLQQELAERRVRRLLYQPGAGIRSEPPGSHAWHSSNGDDTCESFCEYQDFETNNEFADNQSHHDSDNSFMEDFKPEEFQDDETTSCPDSVASVVDGDSKSQCVQKTIADSIKLHLDTVKKNMASLERYTQLEDGYRTPDSDRTVRCKPEKIIYKNVLFQDNQLFCMWARLVTFAYQLVQLNHGNCFYDYGSQLLTAVLACDALRRGVNRMCDILQSYVSPIKFTSDHSVTSTADYMKKNTKQRSYESKKRRRYPKIKSILHKTYVPKHSKKNHLAVKLGQWLRMSKKKEPNRTRRHPWRDRCTREWNSISTLWSEMEVDRICRCRVENPMLNLVRYLDDILESDLDDFESL